MAHTREPLLALAAAGAITAEDLKRCTEWLTAVVADRALLAQLPEPERRALLIAAGRLIHPDDLQKRRLVRALRGGKRRAEQAHDRGLRAETGIRVAREAPVFVAPQPLLPGAQPEPEGPELKQPKSCYVCKAEFRRLHHFYDAMCRACGDLNYEKRFQSAPLAGRVALVTGARVKIGYHTALKLLRAGAQVVATTRFPHDAARRYASEPDYAEWGARLHVHGLDLRHSPSVEIFCRYLQQRLTRLDLLINNACQTVRRPPGFYAHLLEYESQPLHALSAELQAPLRGHHECVATLSGAPSLPAVPTPETGAPRSGIHSRAAARGPGGRDHSGPQLELTPAWSGGGAGLGLRASAQLSQIRYDFDDAARRPDLFPDGRLDVDLQQLDLRSQNTWRLTLGEVPTPEMIEVQLVNAVAPFILCAQLKPLMMRTPERDKHVVNVSAMEGIFSRGTKTDRHPHTNMAKAALNMLTLTSARDYVQHGIHMNAVDTGWITDEDPFLHAERKREELDFQPPLDIVDGAARLLDPFFTGLKGGEQVWGKFLKDYRPSDW